MTNSWKTRNPNINILPFILCTLKVLYLWIRPLNEVSDERPLLVRDQHPRPLVRLQSQRLQGEVLDEVIPRIVVVTVAHLVELDTLWPLYQTHYLLQIIKIFKMAALKSQSSIHRYLSVSRSMFNG